MDKKSIIGFVLMGMVLFLFSWLNRPDAAQLQKQQQYKDSIAAVETARLAVLEKEAILAQQESERLAADTVLMQSVKDSIAQNEFGVFAPYAQGKEEFVTLENEYIELTFSTKGGAIHKARLKDYNRYDSLPVVLFDGEDNQYGFVFKTGARIINTTDLYFTPQMGKDGKSIIMKLIFKDGSYFAYNYRLDPESYMVDFSLNQKGMEKQLSSNLNELNFFWHQMLRSQEKGRQFEERYSALYYKYVGDDKVDYLSESKDDQKDLTTSLQWIACKNQFFSTAFILKNNARFNGAEMSSKVLAKEQNPNYLKEYNIETAIDYSLTDAVPASFSIFLGPNSYPLLTSYDHDVASAQKLHLDKLVPLGASIFRYMNTWVIIPIFTFLGKFISNYGIIILLLTFIIKLFIMPMTYKSYMSTAKMRVLKPQIEEINAKYPTQDKAAEKQKATMDLYTKAGINPMSGCIPMLLQMPILFAMFSFFPSSIELRGQSFLWAKDLSSYDAILTWDTYIPLITPYFGNHLSLFCLLMAITNIVYTKINMDSTGGATQMPGMKFMMYVMPLMFLFMFNNYASGLSYYYFVSTLITIAQTYAFRYFIDEKKVLAKIEANKKKPRKKSGFMARLEEAQREQQKALKNRK